MSYFSTGQLAALLYVVSATDPSKDDGKEIKSQVKESAVAIFTARVCDS